MGFAVAPDDSILVASEADEVASIFTSSPTGEELSQELMPPIDTPGETAATTLSLADIESGPSGNAIYSGALLAFPADGPPSYAAFLVGLGAEPRIFDGGGSFQFGITSDHGIYGAAFGGGLLRLDSRGGLEFDQHDGLSPMHLAVAGERVALGDETLASYDADGALEWTYSWPSFEAGGAITSVKAFENGDILVAGVERDSDRQRIRLVRLGGDGSEVRSSP